MSKEFERILINHCAPAIRGKKAANLINCSIKEIPLLLEDIKEINDKGRKICIKVLKVNGDRIMILVYNRKELAKILFEKNNYEYLLSFGYHDGVLKMLNHLEKRVNQSNQFPNEIGVFLGYDLNDIKDFNNGTKKCLYCGYWKVYSDLERKKEIFSSYNQCKKILLNYVNSGNSLYNLV